MTLTAPATLEPTRLRQVFGAFPTGVTAVAARVNGAPVGLAANSFTSVSLTPPLVSVCIGVESRTWPLLASSPRIGISVLAEHHGETSRNLSRASAERFAGLDWDSNDGGAVFIAGAAAWFDCAVHTVVPAGDHRIVLLEVLDLGLEDSVAPLVFHGSRYRRLDRK